MSIMERDVVVGDEIEFPESGDGRPTERERRIVRRALGEVRDREIVRVGEPVIDLQQALIAIQRIFRRAEQRVSHRCRRRNLDDGLSSGYATSEDSGLLLIREYSARVRHPKHTPQTEVPAEEEGLVLDDRAPQIRVEIVPD